MQIALREYLDKTGRSPFGRWLEDLDAAAAYRVYFGKDGDTFVILVAGGTKKRQAQDITLAQERWSDYKQRKTKGE